MTTRFEAKAEADERAERSGREFVVVYLPSAEGVDYEALSAKAARSQGLGANVVYRAQVR